MAGTTGFQAWQKRQAGDAASDSLFDYLAAPGNAVEASDFNRFMTAITLASGCVVAGGWAVGGGRRSSGWMDVGGLRPLHDGGHAGVRVDGRLALCSKTFVSAAVLCNARKHGPKPCMSTVSGWVGCMTNAWPAAQQSLELPRVQRLLTHACLTAMRVWQGRHRRGLRFRAARARGGRGRGPGRTRQRYHAPQPW